MNHAVRKLAARLRRRPLGVNLLRQLAWVVERVQCVESCRQQAELPAEALALLAIERKKKLLLRGTESEVQGDDDSMPSCVATTRRARRSAGSGRRSMSPAASRSSRRYVMTVRSMPRCWAKAS